MVGRKRHQEVKVQTEQENLRRQSPGRDQQRGREDDQMMGGAMAAGASQSSQVLPVLLLLGGTVTLKQEVTGPLLQDGKLSVGLGKSGVAYGDR